MRKSFVAPALGALVGVVALASSAVAHHHTVTVTAGPTSSGDVPFFAISDGQIDFKVDNGSFVVDMHCDAVNAEGNIHAGVGSVAATIGAVNRVNTPEPFDHSEWKNCDGPLGLDMNVEPQNDWELHPTGGETSGTSDDITGVITGPNGAPLKAWVWAKGAQSACNFYVEGEAEGTFHEDTQELEIHETGFTYNLTVTSAPGDCFGQVPAGSPADFVGTFLLGADHASNSKAEIVEEIPVYVSP